MAATDNLTLIYVLDPPALVGDAIINLCSIRAQNPDLRVIAYVPEEKRALLPPYVVEFHAAMGAEIRYMKTEGIFSPVYKQGNKILACCAPRETEFTLFVDTDTALVCGFDTADICTPDMVSVVPEGVLTWGKNPASWQAVYAKFGMELPVERVRLMRYGRESLPYFNAGVIGFPTRSDFASAWLETSLAIDADQTISQRRPWLDQIALPVALRRAGLGTRVLPEAWNLSITRRDKVTGDEEARQIAVMNAVDARIVHFHQPQFFAGTRYLPLIDAAIARATCYPDLAALTAPRRAHAERRDHVWRRFHELKMRKDRSPAENSEFRAISAEKQQLQARRHRPELFTENWPASILPAAGEKA